MKKILRIGILTVLLITLSVGAVSAQDEEPYKVRLRRDFGYGNGMDLQGKLTLSLVGDETRVASVTFFMDEEALETLESPPFRVSFSTEDYDSGLRSLSAQVKTTDGQTYTTKAVTANFLTAEQAQSGMKNTLLPILGVLLGVFALSMLIQYFTSGKKSLALGQTRSYNSPYGGAVCPKCGHPFNRSIMGMNLLIGRFEICPSCKKFIHSVRATPAELAAAELEETRKLTGTTKPFEAQSTMTDQLEESRYVDLDDGK